MAPAKTDPPRVYLLNLKDDGAPDVTGGYINLPAPVTPYTLRFAIQGASSICREGKLWINVPEGEEVFEREKLRPIPFVSLSLLNCFNGGVIYHNAAVSISGGRSGSSGDSTRYALRSREIMRLC